MKSNKWCLRRINNRLDGETYLNIGDTTIGRNQTADVITKSNICSRNHCTIQLDGNDNVIISNQSSNGTYVNEEKIEEARRLQHGDCIGLGCNQSIMDLVEPSDLDKYFIYKLIDKSIPAEFVDLISDDEEEVDVKPKIENYSVSNIEDDAVPNEPEFLVNNNPPDPQIPINPMPNDQDDENELIYSQQMMMEIKQEVNCPDEIVAHEDDFSILIDSDDEFDVSNHDSWSNRLSQNQDFRETKSKVMQSIQSQKRKVTKQIDAIPLVPTKRARRMSISAAPSLNTSVPTKSTNGQQENESTVQPSTSKQSNITGKEPEQRFIDHFDPFAKKDKKDVQTRSFEDILKNIDTGVKKRKERIAHKPKKLAKMNTLPILRLQNGSWPSEGKRIKQNLKVSFAAEPSVRVFQPTEDEAVNVIITSPAKVANPTNDPSKMYSFENDPLHNIITDITEWKTDWIAQRHQTPPLNGVDLIICPLVDQYTAFESYKRTVTPLLKHELWSSIQAENRIRNRFEVKVTMMNLFKRADSQRYVYHAQVLTESANSKAHIGDFVLVETSEKSTFFAYVTNQRFTRSGCSKTNYITMETSVNVIKMKNSEGASLFITPISNIRTELKLFNAVFYVDKTPLKDLILNPLSYRHPTISDHIRQFQYSGYDKLNGEQMDILKNIYNKCLNTNLNLSLIEGPPGTGKTRLIVSIILQLLFGLEMKKKLRILVLTSSNAAVDIIAKRLLHVRDKLQNNDKQKFLNIVRFGVLNSMHPDVRKIAPQNLKNNNNRSPPAQCVQLSTLTEARKELLHEIERLRGNTRNVQNFNQDRIRDCENRLKQVTETIEMKSNGSNDLDGISEVMEGARVVLSTLSSSINLKQYVRKFDVCFIDEASQCTEPWSLVPLQYNITSFILVGDCHQLSPVVLSSVCREKGMERSLFTRLHNTMSNVTNRDAIKNTYGLTTQYRMHPEICTFPNAYFYNNRLTSAPQTADSFALQPYSVFSLNFLQSNSDMINYYNVGEANFIVQMLKVMIRHANPKDFSYGIITPYAKQRTEIQNLLSKSQSLTGFEIPVNTIDSYQGQEKDVIILCTTRTSGIGFLANPPRLNVALTRAKRCLVICGNFKSISNIPVWSELLKDAKRRKKYNTIPDDCSFQTIADLLVNKQPKPRSAQ